MPAMFFVAIAHALLKKPGLATSSARCQTAHPSGRSGRGDGIKVARSHPRRSGESSSLGG
jgi:hypothetical protein